MFGRCDKGEQDAKYTTTENSLRSWYPCFQAEFWYEREDYFVDFYLTTLRLNLLTQS